MMKKSNAKWLKYTALAFAAGTGSFAFAQPAGNALLNSLNKGMWELRSVGGGPSRAAQSRICLGSPTKLVQIQHGNAKCTQKILSVKSDRITVHYSCPGLGQGLTNIRKESRRVIHIDSQGVRNGSPFNFSVEGRLKGRC